MAVDVGDGRFDLGRVVGQTFSLTGRRFAPFALLSFLFVGIPYAAVLVASTAAALQLIAIPTGFYLYIPVVGGIVTFLSALILQGALTRAAIDGLARKKISLGAALGAGFRFMFPLLGLGLLMGIAIVLGLILLVIPGLILMVRYSVSAPILVVEDHGVTGSMGRSADLSRGHRWAIFGLLLAYAVVSYAVDIPIKTFSQALYALTAGIPGLRGIPVVYIALDTLTQVIMQVISTVGTAAIYFELRRAKEGVNVDELAAVFD